MSIGIAVPCYSGHIKKLFDLLDSIENQTIKPNKVSVSCSSTENIFETKQYSFPLEIIITKEFKNAAQNRNIAMSYLNDMDYVTFMDADDIMHPQRIEILLFIFKKTNCDFIVHNFYLIKEDFKIINNIDYIEDKLLYCSNGYGLYFEIKDNKKHIHHSQSSVKQHILKKVQYFEDKKFCRCEDSFFCNYVLRLENIKNVYISNELSYYNPSHTQF